MPFLLLFNKVIERDLCISNLKWCCFKGVIVMEAPGCQATLL